MVAGLAAYLIFSEQEKPREPAGASTEDAKRIPDLIAKLTALDSDAEHAEGPYHKIKPDVERELWNIVSNLPVAAGYDRLLFSAIDEVYTKYFPTYQNGYIFHYPYLDSVKAVTLCDKILKEYPGFSKIPDVLVLKGFALRVKPPPSGHETHESFAAQIRWTPRPDDARQAYELLLEKYPKSVYAEQVRDLIKRGPPPIDLPTWFEKEDPRTQ